MLKVDASLSSKAHLGFSIVEMSVVVGIVGTVVVLAMPAFRTWMVNASLRANAESIQDGLRLTQSEALKRNTNVDFVLTEAEPVASSIPASTPPTSAGVLTGKNWIIQVSSLSGANPIFIRGYKGKTNSSGVSVTSLNDDFSGVNDGGSKKVEGLVTFNGLGRMVQPTTALAIDMSATGSLSPIRITVSTGGKIKMCINNANLPSGDPQKCT